MDLGKTAGVAPIREGPERFRGPAEWRVSFDAARPVETLEVSGSCCRIHQAGVWTSVIIDLPHSSHTLAVLGPGDVRIDSGGACLPVFFRTAGSRVRLGNTAMALMDRGEEVEIRTAVLIQQLLGANYPQANIFRDIGLLEADASYTVDSRGLRYLGTNLEQLAGVTADDAMALVHARFEQLFSDGRPICVLLSGGYDSRLNLAIAQRAASLFGNPIHTYHEYKDEREHEIARRVARAARVPFHVEGRDSFSAAAGPLVFNPRFVRSHSGTYRDNIPRWHFYLEWIRSEVPDCIIIGLGAEAHKGKHYRQIRDLRRDGERVLGTDMATVRVVARALDFPTIDLDAQGHCFDELCAHADVFEEPSYRVDFLHYQTYVVNGYGHRCYYLQQLFQLPFPFLESSFLSAVFSLAPEEKQDFRLVSREIEELAPDLFALPFTSGNAKSLVEPSSAYRVLKYWLRPARRFRALMAAPPRKGKTTLTPAERERLSEAAPRSADTEQLQKRLLGRRRPPVRLEYLVQAYLYFRLLEEEAGVTIRCV